MALIEFIEVGRFKRSWQQELPIDNMDAVAMAAKSRGGIMSSCVEVFYDEDDKNGEVVVGGRTIGKFRVVETP